MRFVQDVEVHNSFNAIRDWLQNIVRSGAARNISDIATKCGIHPSTLTRFVQNGSTQELRESTLCKIEGAFGPRPASVVSRDRNHAFFESRPEFFPENEARQKLVQDNAIAKEAASYGLDTESIASKAIEEAVKAERIRRWNEENREAIQSWNDLVEREGLWSDGIRAF